MVIEGCKAKECPCTMCVRFRVGDCDACIADKTNDSFDTKILCKAAREYCEKVNGESLKN